MDVKKRNMWKKEKKGGKREGKLGLKLKILTIIIILKFPNFLNFLCQLKIPRHEKVLRAEGKNVRK